MEVKAVNKATILFNEYADCEKIIMFEGKMIERQPAISEGNFKNLMRHLHSIEMNKKMES